MPQDRVDMSNADGHIADERLAAFAEEAPTADELAHLAGCVQCRHERDAYAQLAVMAHAMRRESASPDAPRLTDWESLAVGLRREGLLTSHPAPVSEVAPAPVAAINRDPASAPAGRDVTIGAPRRATPVWLRVAAALVLTAGGAALGRMSAVVPATALDSGPSGSSTPATLASAGADADGYASVQQATDALSLAQREYERASLWLAANDTTVHSSDVYRARLAALDQMMTASRAALRDAPQDPVLNHYFLAAYTAREATLQALGGTLPVDKSLERY